MSLDPIVVDYSLSCSADHAFETYVGRLGEWWDPMHTANPHTFMAVTIEPRLHGRVVEHHVDETEIDWGEVLAWEPGKRLSYTSTLAQTAEHPSEIDVTFTPSAGGCRVHFSHQGWNDGNARDHDKFKQWSTILDRFAQLADS